MSKEDSGFNHEKIYFDEMLGFKRRWILIIFIIEVVIYVSIIASRFIDGLREIYLPVSFIGVSLITLIFLLSTTLLLKLKLRTTVEKEGIRYRMMPFERKGHLILPEKIEKYFIKRVKKKNNTKRSKTTLYIQLKTGKKILIQTRHPQQLIKAVHQLMEEQLK